MEEFEPQGKELLEGKYNELVRVLESFESLEKSKEWATLKELVFDKDLASIERQLYVASIDPILDVPKIYKLQGKRDHAYKYQIDKYIETLKKQLENIKKQIQ